MWCLSDPRRLVGTLLLPLVLQATRSAAGPAVNVALKASFDSAPFLVELLETAAEENSTSYFPLLDRIATGYFEDALTDEKLYNKFLDVLKEDGHFTDLHSLSSFQFALSIHSAAPRIEAFYQYYNGSVDPLVGDKAEGDCFTWLYFQEKRYCSPTLEHAAGVISAPSVAQDLPFDRVLNGGTDSPASILYADISSPEFRKFHSIISQTAKEGQTSYRVRHRPSAERRPEPLYVNGYGVELALKRTDYIVIDDRDAPSVSEGKTPESTGGRELDEEAIADLKPLSSSEVLKLGLKAASFALTSDAPFDTLKKISQDFPKYSSMIAAHEISNEFMTEFSGNRELFLPAGYSIIWINGVQVPARDMNAFSLLEQMRRERKLVNALRDLGLSPREAVDLLSHPAIAEPKANNEPQRYDWRDTTEGGNAIIWLNDLEKDKRYDGWPNSVLAIMQKTYPGQLPNVRRDIHNVIVFVDLSKSQEMALIVEQLQNFVKRGIPIRWGIVPLIKSEAIKDHSKIIYHLTDTYGLATALQYLKTILDSRKLSVADESTFNSIIKDRKLRKDKVTVPFHELFQSSALDERVEAAKNYAARLGVKTESIAFANGAALPMGDNWLSTMGTRVSADLRTLQQAVYEHEFEEEDWLPQLFLDNSTARRNPLIIPADEDGIKIIDASLLDTDYADLFDKLPRLEAKKVDDAQLLVHLLVIADMRTENGLKFISEAIQFHNENENIEVVFLDNPVDDSQRSLDLSEHLLKAAEASGLQDYISKFGIPDNSNEGISQDQKALYQAILKILDMEAGQDAVVMNGRFAGPIDASTVFVKSDFAQLLEYETIKRLKPAYTALNELELTQKITTPFQAAKLTSIVALSQVSDAPEGIFESASSLRLNVFNKWNSSSSAIVTGDAETASIHIVAAVDPASEIAQRWIPILHVLSELDGVHLKLFPNPREKLQELPVKRFYRHVLESKPTFHEDGSLQGLSARFGNLPEEALLTAALDVPPAWLVAPKESPYDLDNIKISGLKDRVGDGDIEAIYELQYILIEGHSRDVTTGQAPRGVQLVLGTEKNKHHADTIIMANLGYFQFKGNPGLWRMDLQEGRNKDIYNLDSAGSMGYAAKPGDESTEIALTSFQGVTLFPRLSRKAGQEEEDVLEVTPGSVKDYVSKGLNFAEKVLTKVGLQKEKPNADINIFSVASGHLYERMLNIMMVSVMKHTKHSVKFWFIEQFLSPSFKDFIPILAEEYGFSYEMVTYKWPHWLRGQKEKQREIWGYKILFLDVLFPLSLDKVIFVDADQIVRTDMYELVTHDLQGAPYGFTPMCDSRTEMEGFRFWKQGYWANFLRGLPYHISALYVVDLKRFRQIAAGDRLRQQYHQLSADPNSLSNLDQDLPNHMQQSLPIHSLPQEWLWCETWCSDESLKDAKTIDLCNNPLTKEPKLDRARRQVPEWTVYDDEIAAVAARARQLEVGDDVVTESITTTSTVLLERTPSQPPKKDEL